MFWFLIPFAIVGIILLVLGLINPTLIFRLIGLKLTRMQVIWIFGAIALIFTTLTIISFPKPKTIAPTVYGIMTNQTTTNVSEKEQPAVKKSSTGICHLQGTTYYNKTTNYKSFDSLDACLRGGGRLPKK